jgi:hypothetical protein
LARFRFVAYFAVASRIAASWLVRLVLPPVVAVLPAAVWAAVAG